jgi:Spy/CpxP family protein refolding chaperone
LDDNEGPKVSLIFCDTFGRPAASKALTALRRGPIQPKETFMKRTLAIAALLTLSAPLASPLLAEGPGGHSGMGMSDQQRQEMRDRRLERLSTDLSLTADQKAKVKAAFDEQEPKMMAAHKEAMDKQMALQKEMDAKIDAVLTPEQKDKFAKLREEQKTKMAERMEHRRDMKKEMKGDMKDKKPADK